MATTIPSQDSKISVPAEEVEFGDSGKLEKEQLDRAAGDVLMIGRTDEVRRIQVPSDDPNDPLRFSKWRKLGIVFTCCWFSNFSLLSLSGIGTFFNELFGMYLPMGKTPSQIVGLATYPSMVMAFGSLGLLPLAIVFGRRPVFLLAILSTATAYRPLEVRFKGPIKALEGILIAFGASIGAATSKDFNGHFISRIFLGLATGATESLLPLIISDVTYLDERGFYFGIYWATQNGVSTALIIALSYATAALTWRWFYWIFVIALALEAIFVLFLSPETKFIRSPTAVNGQVVFTEFGTTHIISDAEAEARFGDIQEHAISDTSARKKSFLQNLQPFDKPTPGGLRIWLDVCGKILECLSSPGVIFATLASSISLGIGIAITLIYSNLLVEEWGWSPGSVGLFNAGVIPACFLAMLYSGYFGDKVNIWLARRNGEALYATAPITGDTVGVIAIDVTANASKQHSYWGLFIGWAIYQFSFVCIVITTTTFAAEVIPSSPGAAMVILVGGKNIISFRASYGLTPMLQIYSYLVAFMILLGIYIGIFALGIPVYFLNDKWKKRAL
ncbi:major facilitator superfamily domain-containing protein [Rhexocercosporidium sp. MPI-PUGE-AT-0058]|nr:major facilitator superfamily domain-containing protein [Rhexocercosporidium sp. MPI-PUGE-AT-0058]